MAAKDVFRLFCLIPSIKVYAICAGRGQEVDALPAHQQAEEGEDADPKCGTLGFGILLTDVEEQ